MGFLDLFFESGVYGAPPKFGIIEHEGIEGSWNLKKIH